MQLGGVCEFEHRAVGFVSVEVELSLEADDLFDRFSEFPDRDVFAGTDVDMGIPDFVRRATGYVFCAEYYFAGFFIL